MPSLYRLDIAPLTPLPLTRSPLFSYRHNGALPLGALVQVPFGRRSLRGIVYAAHPLPGRAPLWMKPIERVIREYWLTDEQRILAERVSETYFSSLGNTLKHFVFSLPSKVPENDEVKSSPKKKSRPPKKIAGFELASDTALLTKLQQILTQHLKKKETTLIVVPDLLSLNLLQTKLETMVPEETIVALSSKLTPKQMGLAWETLRRGEAKIVVGTRQVLFAPLVALRHIVMLFPEEHLSYKQWDMTPYYEASVMVQTLALLFPASLTFLTTSGGLATLVPSAQKTWKRETGKQILPLVIDRRKDGKGARAKGLSKEVEKLLVVLPQKAQALFIAKERGVSGLVICQHCRTTARCPSCQHALAENKEGVLRCLNCTYESSFFPKCAKCGHMHFKGFGIGTVRFERELERQFPTKKILRLDRDSLRTTANFKARAKELREGRFDWIITTPEIGSLLQLPKQDLIVMLEADHSLAFPDFEGEERLLIETKRLLGKLGETGTLAIQTFTPEERIWQHLSQGEIQSLETLLFEERESFGYPPVTAIIKISLPKDAKGMSEKDLETIRSRFQRLLAEEKAIELTPLYKPKKQYGSVSPSFLIKYPSTTKLPDTVLTFLRRESAHLKIDVHPLHLH